LQADKGIAELRDAVDTLITIPNEKLLTIVGNDVTVAEAFKRADEVLHQAVKGISDLITVHGLINLDFADVRTVMNEMGMALMGTGEAEDEGRALDAATKAISSPLLEDMSIKGATGILINITGGPDMTLHEISEASKVIQGEAHDDANILFGAVIDEKMEGKIRVTVIATGFNKPIHKSMRQMASQSASLKSNIANVAQVSHVQSVKSQLWKTPQVSQNTLVNQIAHTRTQSSFPAGATRRAPYEDQLSISTEMPLAKKVFFSETKETMPETTTVPDYGEDEYDIPTFLRKQAD